MTGRYLRKKQNEPRDSHRQGIVMKEDDFEQFYQEAYGESDIGRRRIRDVFTREEAREVFDAMMRQRRPRRSSR